MCVETTCPRPGAKRDTVQFIEPASKSTCTAGSPCTIEWLDDGNSPLLNKVGVVTAGLYHGNQVNFHRGLADGTFTLPQQLVQTIQPLDVAAIHSIQFTVRRVLLYFIFLLNEIAAQCAGRA